MNIVLVDYQNSDTPLILEPVNDTLFVLTGRVPETKIILRLQKTGVRAFIFGLFHTKKEEHIEINQDHVAPHTESHVLLKTVVMEDGKFSYQGNLHIQAGAESTVASQEVRGLLLSEDSRFKVVPSLEIIPKDVVCKHKASSSPVNKDSLYALQTKGFSESEAQSMLENAFLKSAFDTLNDWGLSEEEIVQVQNYFSNILTPS